VPGGRERKRICDPGHGLKKTQGLSLNDGKTLTENVSGSITRRGVREGEVSKERKIADAVERWFGKKKN